METKVMAIIRYIYDDGGIRGGNWTMSVYSGECELTKKPVIQAVAKYPGDLFQRIPFSAGMNRETVFEVRLKR